jgi:transposase
MRYELADFEWAAIRSFLPNKPRGIPRVEGRRVLSGIFGPYAGQTFLRNAIASARSASACIALAT